MACSQRCNGCTIIYGNCGLLPEIHRMILEDHESITSMHKKRKIFVWDQKCEEIFNKLKESVNYCTYIKNNKSKQGLCCVH